MKQPINSRHLPTPTLYGRLGLLIFLLLIPGIAGYSQDAGFTNYSDKAIGLNVSFPNKWELSQGRPRTGFMLPIIIARGGKLKSPIGDVYLTPSCDIFLIDSIKGMPDKSLKRVLLEKSSIAYDSTLPDYYQYEANIKSIFWTENVRDPQHHRLAYKAANFEYYFLNRNNVYQLSCECEYSKMDSLKKVFDQIAASVYLK